MNDLKKTFLAGFFVLLILLLTPYYLQLIGYQDVVVEQTETTTEEAAGDNSKQKTSVSLPPVIPPPVPSGNINTSEQTFRVESLLYQADISTIGGGSFENYILMEDGTNKYLGGYTEQGLYQDSINVSLVLDQKESCAPCVGVIYDGESEVLKVPFVMVDNNIFDLNRDILINNEDSLLITMQYSDSRFTIEKTTTFFGDSFATEHIINAQDVGGKLEQIYLIWDKGLRNTEKNLYDDVQTYSAAYISSNKEIEDLWFAPSSISDQTDPVSLSGVIDWAAIRTKYFITAFVPSGASFASIDGSPYMLNQSEVVPSYSASVFSANNTLKSTLYVGPLDIDHVGKLNTSLDRIMNFGWFIIQPFSRGVLWLLKTMHSFGLNYGVILILFAFLIRIITGPLMKKSFESSQNMQTVQPKLKKLQEKYKNDSQKLNQEMVKLYRQEGVNPLGGCLPMLLQMPLLFSLFLVFRSTIEFRGAPFFGWISNLAQPDTIFYLPFNVPIYGDQVAFLPILLGISMFLTQKMSMANMDSQQKPFMYIMSAFFFLIFNSFPSGLNLYYLVYNILNYMQQKSLKKA